MKYRKKLQILSITIAILALAYIFGLIFTPDRLASRNASYSWLEPKLAANAEKIVISNVEDEVTLVKKMDTWYVQFFGTEYPARQLRVTDLISSLTRRTSFPIRSTSASTHERLGLDADNAARITVSGEYGRTLLDLLIGYGDVTAQNIYLRKFDSNEVRSGEDAITSYLSGGIRQWYNLRLIPESEDNQLDVDKVQRLSVYAPETGGLAAPLIFSRRSRQWICNKIDSAELDMDKVNSFIRGVLFAEGEIFTDDVLHDDEVFDNTRIVIELGTANVKTIYLSEALEDGRRYATSSGADFVYSLASWMAARLIYPENHFRTE